MEYLEVPSETECWSRWTKYLARYGACEATSNGVLVRLDPRMMLEQDWTAYVVLSTSELHEYVDSYVRYRIDLGLDDGLEAGLPNPLTDSIFEGIGVQSEPRVTYALQGLVFEPEGNP